MLMPPEIEADALADDRQAPARGIHRALVAGSQNDHPGRVVAAGTDRQEHAHAQFGRPGRLDDVDRQAVLFGQGPGLARQHLRRDVVGGSVVQPPRQVGPLADDHAALGGALQSHDIRARGNENQLVQGRRYVLVVVAIDSGGLKLPLDDAPGEKFCHREGAAVDAIAQVAEPDRQRLHVPARQASFDRRADAQHDLPRDGVWIAGCDSQHPRRAELPAGRHYRAESFGLELTERHQRRELAARALVQLGQGAFELELAREGHREHVRGYVPRLVANDAQLHDQALRRLSGGSMGCRRPKGAGRGRRSNDGLVYRLGTRPRLAARARLPGAVDRAAGEVRQGRGQRALGRFDRDPVGGQVARQLVQDHLEN